MPNTGGQNSVGLRCGLSDMIFSAEVPKWHLEICMNARSTSSNAYPDFKHRKMHNTSIANWWYTGRVQYLIFKNCR